MTSISSTNSLQFTAKSKRNLVLFLGLFIFLTLALLFAYDYVMALDTTISEWVFSWRGPNLNAFFAGFTQLFNPLPSTIVVVAIGIWAYFKGNFHKLLPLWFVLTIATGGLLVNPLVKNLVQRNRPPVDVRLIMETTYSYPSGHAFMSTSTLIGLCLLIEALIPLTKNQRTGLRVFIGFLIALIMFSRIYLGVHYFTDVVAGCLLALVWLNITRWIVTKKLT